MTDKLLNQVTIKLFNYKQTLIDIISNLLMDHTLFTNETSVLLYLDLSEQSKYYNNNSIYTIIIDNNTIYKIDKCIDELITRFWYIITYEIKHNRDIYRNNEFELGLLISAIEYDDNLSNDTIKSFILNHNDIIDSITKTIFTRGCYKSHEIEIRDIDRFFMEENVNEDNITKDRDLYWLYELTKCKNFLKNFHKLLWVYSSIE